MTSGHGYQNRKRGHLCIPKTSQLQPLACGACFLSQTLGSITCPHLCLRQAFFPNHTIKDANFEDQQGSVIVNDRIHISRSHCRVLQRVESNSVETMQKSNFYFEFNINVNIFKAQGVLTPLKSLYTNYDYGWSSPSSCLSKGMEQFIESVWIHGT